MTNEVEFNEWRAPTKYKTIKTPKMIMWVIKYSGGRIKDEREASYVLIGFVVIAIVISIILLSITFGDVIDIQENMLPAEF